MELTLIILELNIFQKKIIGNKNIIINIYRIQAYDSFLLMVRKTMIR